MPALFQGQEGYLRDRFRQKSGAPVDLTGDVIVYYISGPDGAGRLVKRSDEPNSAVTVNGRAGETRCTLTKDEVDALPPGSLYSVYIREYETEPSDEEDAPPPVFEEYVIGPDHPISTIAVKSRDLA